MLTISQLAAYAGVTVAAVRHYHRIGLLPEPERNRSGYRTYDASAVVRLIRIHVLADAGVPLAQVEDLLDAEPERFAAQVRDIEERLGAEARRLRDTRRRLLLLAAGDQLALPDSVVGYLDRLRDLGVEERYVEKERDAWIVVAAQLPAEIDAIIATKHDDLNDPDVLRLYSLVSDALDWSADDPRVVETAEIIDRISTRDTVAGRTGAGMLDDQVVALLDAAVAASSPAAERLLTLLEDRGWSGFTLIERASTGPRRDHESVGPDIATTSDPP